LKKTVYTHGLLFRAEKNGTGGPLRYQSVHERWAAACQKAGVQATLHACRHRHARELVNAAGTTGAAVSLATIRKRLGHRHIASTLRYAELSDQAADQEMRAWRRGLSGHAQNAARRASNPVASVAKEASQ
jgi:integrase